MKTDAECKARKKQPDKARNQRPEVKARQPARPRRQLKRVASNPPMPPAAVRPSIHRHVIRRQIKYAERTADCNRLSALIRT